jgi:peptide/nickel transport system substrate-binding protein
MPSDVTRRRILAATGGIGATVLAGCGGNGADNGENGGGEQSVYTIAANVQTPADIQWNPYMTTAPSTWPAHGLLYDYLVHRSAYPRGVDTSEFPEQYPLIVEEHTVEDGTLTFSLNDAYTWHNGDPVVAEDVLTKFKIEKLLGQRTGRVWEEIAAPDDTTVEFELTAGNPNIFLPQLLPNYLRTKHDTKFADLLETLESATTDDELQSAKQEVIQTRVENPVGNGPWQFESATDSQMRLVPYDDHPEADALNIDELVIEGIPNNNQRWQSFRQGILDSLSGTPPKDIENQFPDSARRMEYVSTAGDCLKFNHDRMFSDPRLRKAVAYVVNRWQNTHNAKDFVDVIKYPNGLPNRVTQEYLGEDPDLLQYGYESSKTEPAAELLRAAGYTREDGQWVDENGETLTIEIISGSGGTWKLNNQSAAQTLSDFGIDAVPSVLEGATYGQRLDNGAYDIAVSAWGAFGGGRHPFNFFSQEYNESKNSQQNIDPTAAEIPYPIGDPQGDTETVDITAKIDALAQAAPGDEERTAIRELAWIYNQHLPRLPLMNGVSRTFISTDGWQVPAADSQWMMASPEVDLFSHGELRADT